MTRKELTMIEDDLKNLAAMTLAEAKNLFRDYFNCNPPKRSRSFYNYVIGYRMQELAFGGLSMDTKKLLLSFDTKAQSTKKKLLAPAGTSIIKNYKGKDYEIRILEHGFCFDGRHYKSLSGIAKKITGMRISGKVFFGFTERKR